jgi:tetratricopeptide (TPR) repeat protein
MFNNKIVWPLAAFLLLIAVPAQAGFLEWRWERYMEAGLASYKSGNYARAERQLTAALTLAESFGADHPNLATSLNNLASLYYAEDRFNAAEPLYLRALEIWKTSLGPDHPNVAKVLINLAALYRAKGDAAEADRLDRRVEAIRASPPQPEISQSGDMAASKTPQIDAAAAREVIASGAIDQEVAAIDPISRGATGQIATAAPETKLSLLGNEQGALLEQEKVPELARDGVIAESPNEKVVLLENEGTTPPAESAASTEIVGNTMTGFSQGGWWTEYFAPDGTIKGLWRNKRYSAKWSIEGDALCLDYPTRGRSCLLYSLEGDQVIFSRQDGKGGKREFKLLSGNPRNL